MKKWKDCAGCFAYVTVNIHSGSQVVCKQRAAGCRLLQSLPVLVLHCKSQCSACYFFSFFFYIFFFFSRTHHMAFLAKQQVHSALLCYYSQREPMCRGGGEWRDNCTCHFTATRRKHLHTQKRAENLRKRGKEFQTFLNDAFAQDDLCPPSHGMNGGKNSIK